MQKLRQPPSLAGYLAIRFIIALFFFLPYLSIEPASLGLMNIDLAYSDCPKLRSLLSLSYQPM